MATTAAARFFLPPGREGGGCSPLRVMISLARSRFCAVVSAERMAERSEQEQSRREEDGRGRRETEGGGNQEVIKALEREKVIDFLPFLPLSLSFPLFPLRLR